MPVKGHPYIIFRSALGLPTAMESDRSRSWNRRCRWRVAITCLWQEF